MPATPRFESAAFLLLAGSLCLSGQAYQFELIEVPYPPSSALNYTFATGINNTGTITGQFAFMKRNSQSQLGFKRYQGGAIELIRYPESEPGDGWHVYPTAIRQDGAIAGYATDLDDITRGFILVNGVYSQVSLSSRPGGTTTIEAMNNRGDFVGRYLAANGIANYISSNGVITELPLMLGAAALRLSGIAADGTIVGCHGQRAFIRGPKGHYLFFRVPGAVRTCAEDINNAAGRIVGWYEVSGSLQPKGFVYDYRSDLLASEAVSTPAEPSVSLVRDIPFIDVDVPGATSTRVTGINSHGSLVGIAGIPGRGYTGFLAKPVP